MNKTDWLTKTIEEHKKYCNVIPIKNELLGFCNGDYPTAALLTQLLYWNNKTRIKGGWIAKSAKDWYQELYLSQRQISRVTKQLVKLKLIETKNKKFNGSPTIHYRLWETEFKEAFMEYLETDTSILTKGKNPIERKGEINFVEKNKSILPNDRNSIGQNDEMDFAKRCKSITETTTKTTTEITTEKKADSDFPSFEKIDFNDSEISKVTSDVVPKEKSCGKKEKVIIQLPFESEDFQQIWSAWKSYVLKKFNRTCSEFEEQAALMPLQNYDEAFAKELITKAISDGWRSFHFFDTPNKFQKYLINKNNNDDTANKIETITNFRKAINDKAEELWSDFN